MLEELSVRNLGLIEEARLEPGPGLVVVSGETGTGKTLLMGGLNLLRGSSARTEQVGPAGPEALVEGRFLHRGSEVVVSRRLVSGGRNRAYLDGEMVPARLVEERMGGLVEMVGQHDHLIVGRTAEVRRMVDSLLDRPGQAAWDSYASAWSRLTGLREDLGRLGGDRRALERELEMVRFQAEEIAASGFGPGDDQALRQRADRMRHAEELGAALAEALERIQVEGGAAEALGSAVDALRRAARLDQSLAPLRQQAEDASSLLAELLLEVRSNLEGLERQPFELGEAEARLALLGGLRRKYGDTLEEVLAFGRQAEERRTEIATLLERASRLEAELDEAERRVAEAGGVLADARRHAGRRLEERAAVQLGDLAFSHPVVRVEFRPAGPSASGTEEARLLFASHADLQPGPVSRVASGGELSRLVLSLRLASAAGEAPVVAFDEIDAGLGGEAALALGRKLAALAEHRQVLCVTHLPQVAAFADTHFVVERRGNRAAVRRVEGEPRLEEISRMLAGLPHSERGRGHAEELLTLRQAG